MSNSLWPKKTNPLSIAGLLWRFQHWIPPQDSVDLQIPQKNHFVAAKDPETFHCSFRLTSRSINIFPPNGASNNGFNLPWFYQKKQLTPFREQIGLHKLNPPWLGIPCQLHTSGLESHPKIMRIQGPPSQCGLIQDPDPLIIPEKAWKLPLKGLEALGVLPSSREHFGT